MKGQKKVYPKIVNQPVQTLLRFSMPWVLEPNLAEPNQISDQNQVIQKRKESFRLFIPKSFKIEQEIKTKFHCFFLSK